MELKSEYTKLWVLAVTQHIISYNSTRCCHFAIKSTTNLLNVNNRFSQSLEDYVWVRFLILKSIFLNENPSFLSNFCRYRCWNVSLYLPDKSICLSYVGYDLAVESKPEAKGACRAAIANISNKKYLLLVTSSKVWFKLNGTLFILFENLLKIGSKLKLLKYFFAHKNSTSHAQS